MSSGDSIGLSNPLIVMQTESFIKLLFGSFFRWWWTAVTGVATLLSFFAIPNGIVIGRTVTALLIFSALTLLFLTISTVYQGWSLYKSRVSPPVFLRFHELEKFGKDLVCLVDGVPKEAEGKIAQLKREVSTGLEVPFAVIEFGERNADGQVLAEVVWISPGHLSDLRSNQFSASDVIVDLFVNRKSMFELTQSSEEGRKLGAGN